ncbi:hypothetical protein NDU88_008619 [Pleurodeles waltl]|uniref:Uncharacterized protein n=1 Tax=Pleurodeles waltl TaxID=8319 RepID=A0AAV7RSX2_PLEWA|nr:hypothetical protein NDU88_008619 [Pleurodeles waltl]
MEAITRTHMELASKTYMIAIDINILQAVMLKVVDRVTVTEDNVGELQQEVATLKDTVSSLQKLSVRLEEHMEDVLGRSRKNNLRFVLFLETVVEQSMKKFLKAWLAATVPPLKLSAFFSVDRSLLHPATPSRGIIAHLFNYRGWDAIL